MSELANNKSIRKEVQDLGETLGITPNGKTNQQKIRSIGEQASDGTYATKEYVNTLMSGALKRQIVETLPVEDIDTNTIYMVLDESASQQGNVYNEYLYINEAWELIGTTATSGGLLSEILDANGNARFIEGEVRTDAISGISYSYNKWSLSGTHLMIVLVFSTSSIVSLTANKRFAKVMLPNWIISKIQTIQSSVVVKKNFTNYMGENDLVATLTKSGGTNIEIYSPIIQNIESASIYRIQFDLLIDTE